MQAENVEISSSNTPALNPRFAILLALSESADPHLQALNINCVNTQLMARPLLQRSVEQLVALGCLNISVVTGTRDLACKQLLGRGERFGVTINYVHVNEHNLSQASLMAMSSPPEERIWIASAMTVPHDEILLRLITQISLSGNTIVVSNYDAIVHWSGWGILNWTAAMALILACATEQEFEQAVLRDPAFERIQCNNALTLQSGAAALRALVSLMQQGQPAGVIAQRMRAPGVWIAGDSTIDPSATLKPPLYIGHQVRIDAGAVVGPGVVIETGSIIEAGAFIRNSWILPRTSVGQQTTLINTIVSGNRLLSLDHKALIKVTDPLLLDGDVHTRTATRGPGIIERLMAIVLWLIARPLFCWWRRRLRLNLKLVNVSEHSVAFPERMRFRFETRPTALKPTMHLVRDHLPYALVIHFFKTFYPGLKDIWHGRVSFIGLEPRSLEQMLKLSYTKQLRYAHWPIGLINASMLMRHDTKELRTLKGMPLHRSVQLVLAYVKEVRRSVAQAVISQYAFKLINDIEPQLIEVLRSEKLMKLSQIKPGIAVVLITDESLDVHNVKTFRIQINPIIEQNHTILLDMHQLTFIDSAGLSALLACLRVTTKKHATLRLFGMSQTVQALFELVRMSRVFKLYATDIEALENLPQG